MSNELLTQLDYYVAVLSVVNAAAGLAWSAMLVASCRHGRPDNQEECTAQNQPPIKVDTISDRWAAVNIAPRHR